MLAEAVPVEGLTTGGALVMCASVGVVLTMVVFCLYRVMRLPPVDIEQHLKGQLDIDTRDTFDAD